MQKKPVQRGFKPTKQGTAPDKSYTFNQTLSEPLAAALHELVQELNFDSIQNMTRIVLAKFAKENGKEF